MKWGGWIIVKVDRDFVVMDHGKSPAASSLPLSSGLSASL
jgi:hypothetical protein